MFNPFADVAESGPPDAELAGRAKNGDRSMWRWRRRLPSGDLFHSFHWGIRFIRFIAGIRGIRFTELIGNSVS